VRTALLLVSAIAAFRALGGEPERLSPGRVDPGWSRLAAALASKGNIEAPFTEFRHFPFRRQPTVLHGVLRISREGGLSLQYTDPDPSVLIADSAGLIFRDGRGRSHELAAGSDEAGPIESILPIMRFDLPALFPDFDVRAQRTGGDWQLEFTPRSARAAQSLGTVTVRGSGEEVRHLEFRRSGSQRVEIDVGDARTGVSFSAAERARFFR
jgi:hypothetical protein